MRRVLIALLSLASVASAALTTVTDTVYRADGSLASGSIGISWQAFTNASGQFIPAGNIRNVPIVNGVFSVTLESNVGATPTGTSYTVSYSISGSAVTTWRWYVPVTGPVGLNGVQFPVPGLVGTSAAVNPSQLLQAGAQLGYVLAWNGSYWAPAAGGGGGGSPLFSSILTGTNTSATMTVGTGGSILRSGSGIVDANRIVGVSISSVAGNSGALMQTTGSLSFWVQPGSRQLPPSRHAHPSSGPHVRQPGAPTLRSASVR